VRWTYTAAKKTVRSPNGHSKKLSSSQTSTTDESFRDSLEKDTNNWRTKNLSGIQLENSRFWKLRNEHILRPASELSAGG
jgi:hypothetical protein